MWFRDPVDCKLCYEPYRIFKTFVDKEYRDREFNEMWTADWWWEIQERLPIGATLVPIIIASDKTQLTRFSGDKQAWPVYLTIGNIDKESRRRPSSRATVLLGYIPVAKLEIFKKKNRSGVGYQLFHDCMRAMLQSLKAAGRDGVTMDCADGFVRKAYLIIAAYIADYPEQCLVCCCGESSCPGCLCEPNCRGHTTHSKWRCPAETLQLLADQSNGEYPTEFVDQHLRAINPFWSDLPHCDIFRSMTPDLLHELHRTMVSLLFDRRFRAMAPHPSLRHFKKGISLTTQWTGTERKNMEKVFLDHRVQLAVRGILDFIYYAHFETHCDESLLHKLHKLKHYVDSIRSRGTADGFNTEGTERLHIDLAKLAYNASNKKAYTRQMTVWLRRQESVHKFGSYLQWAVPDSSDDDDEDVEDAPGQDLPEDSDDEGSLRRSPPPRTITTDFKAPDFLDNLADFLHSKSIIPRLVPADNSTFPAYKKLSLTLPAIAEVGSGDTRDTSVLLCVARVRVIFRIPPDFGESQNQSPTLTGLSPFSRQWLARNASSVSFLAKSPAEVIYYRHLRHCAFLPFTSSLRPHSRSRWTPENVLDLCKSFYLNPYLRHHDFYLFRYLIAIDASRKAAAERRVRMKTLGRAGR
ncbi:hypothetical protein B0H13DRAFT_2226800 [Mycena leptocephala]|nr:hypothetical protein B0H13DRAFT_2226800 [Mycena leptocephala]